MTFAGWCIDAASAATAFSMTTPVDPKYAQAGLTQPLPQVNINHRTAKAHAIAARVASLALIVAAMTIATWSEASWSRPQPAPAAADPQRSIDIDEGTIRRFEAEIGTMVPSFRSYFSAVRKCLAASDASTIEQCLESASEADRCGPNPTACAHYKGRMWDMYVAHYVTILSRDRRLGNLVAEAQRKWSAYLSARCDLQRRIDLITAVPYLSFHAESCLEAMARDRALDLRWNIDSLK